VRRPPGLIGPKTSDFGAATFKNIPLLFDKFDFFLDPRETKLDDDIFLLFTLSYLEDRFDGNSPCLESLFNILSNCSTCTIGIGRIFLAVLGYL
jgi:hypothetical protein